MTNDTPQHTLEDSPIMRFVRNADGPCAEFIQVLPEEAAYVLKRYHVDNRNLRAKDMRGYARDMVNGGWPLNGETVKFDEEGGFFDGQHRFTALASLSHLDDISVTFLVVVGLPVDAKNSVDHGIKRTHSDVLKFNGFRNPALLAAVTRKAMQYNDGDVRLHGSTRYTADETLRFLEVHPELSRSAEVAAHVRNGLPSIPQSVVGVAHWAFMKVDDKTAPWFFERLRDGADLKSGDPILTLRNKMINDKDESQRVYHSRYFAYLIRAFNAVRKGEQLYKITAFGRGGEMPSINP